MGLGAQSRRAALGASLAMALVVPPETLAAQEVTIRGRVVDSQSGKGIAGAQVLVRDLQLQVLSNGEGRFELRLPNGNGSVRLTVVVGLYRTVEHDVDPAAAADEPPTIPMERMLFELPGVTVTASRGNARPGEAPVSVSVIGRDELRNRDVTSLNEALPFAQGVTFNAGQMDIRGSSGIARGVGSRVLMLLDGHRALANVGSSVDFGLMPLLDVERIEIVKGPHSTLFGTNAMGGVVNVITRPPVDGARTVVRGYYGVFDTPGERDFTEELLSMQGLQIQHSRRIGRMGTSVFVGREGSDGFRQNGGLQRWRLRARTVWGAETTSPWEVFVNWKHEDAEEFFTWLSPERPLEVDPSQLGDWKRDVALVLGMTATPVVTPSLRVQLRPQMQHVRSRNHHHDNDDFHHSTRWGTDVQLSRSTAGRHSFTTGAEASYTEISSNFLEPTPTTTSLAFFVQDEIELSERLRGTTGMRLDLHRASSAEDDFSINPKIGLVYEPSDRVSLRTSLSRGYRAPSVSEQYSSTVVFGFRVIPNLELRGESAWAGELGGHDDPQELAVVRRGSLLERIRRTDRGFRRAGPGADLPVPQRRRSARPRDRRRRQGGTHPRKAHPAGDVPLSRLGGQANRPASGVPVGPQPDHDARRVGGTCCARPALPQPRRPGPRLPAGRTGPHHSPGPPHGNDPDGCGRAGQDRKRAPGALRGCSGTQPGRNSQLSHHAYVPVLSALNVQSMAAGLLLLVLASPAAAAAQNPGDGSFGPPGAQTAPVRPLVGAEWLLRNIGADDVVVVHLERRPGEYAAEHIAGARPLRFDAITWDGEMQWRSEFRSLDETVAALGAAGIGRDSRVVIYGSSMTATARAWVTFDLLGLGDRAFLLNGGMSAWKSAGGAVETGAPDPVEPGDVTAENMVDFRVSADWIHERLGDPALVLLDARPDDEYTGADGGLGGAGRPGHIPGAAQLYWEELMDPANNTLFRPAGEIARILERHGAGEGRTHVVYCMIGMRASVDYIAARMLGLEVRFYDGSWRDWGDRADLPAETGPDPRDERGGDGPN